MVKVMGLAGHNNQVLQVLQDQEESRATFQKGTSTKSHHQEEKLKQILTKMCLQRSLSPNMPRLETNPGNNNQEHQIEILKNMESEIRNRHLNSLKSNRTQDQNQNTHLLQVLLPINTNLHRRVANLSIPLQETHKKLRLTHECTIWTVAKTLTVLTFLTSMASTWKNKGWSCKAWNMGTLEALGTAKKGQTFPRKYSGE